MGHTGRLTRLTLAAIHHTERTPEAFVTYGIAAIPEFRIAGFIQYFFEGTMQLAILDLPEEITPKLEIDPVLVYGEATTALDQYTILCIGNQFAWSKELGAWQEIKIGDPVDRLIKIVCGTVATPGIVQTNLHCCITGGAVFV